VGIPLSQGILVPIGGDLSRDTVSDPGAGDDHGALPLHLYNDRIPVEPELARNRRSRNRPDEEADPEPNPEVNVLPIRRRPGTTVPDGRNGDGAGDKYDARVLEDTPAVGNGVCKTLLEKKDLRNTG